MKKRLFLISIILLILLPASGVSSQENVDMVILLDSSQSMFSYYNEVTEYVISGLVQQYMRFNDTFHLLSFSDTTQIEIAQTLKTEQDIKSALARLYLLYPLGKNTDILTALRNTHQYVSDLPSASTKFIVLISDGIHSPAGNSPYAAYTPFEVKAEIEKTAIKMRDQGWIIKIVSVPFINSKAGSSSSSETETAEGSQAPGAGNYLSDLSSSLGASITEFSSGDTLSTVTNTIKLPSVVYPVDLSKKDYRFKFPLVIKNPSTTAISMEFKALLVNSATNILEKKQFASLKPLSETTVNLDVRFPDSWQAGKNSVIIEPVFADGIRITPAKATVLLELRHSAVTSLFLALSSNFLKIIIILLGIAAVIAIVLYIRSIHRKAEAPIIDAVLDSASTAIKKDSPIHRNDMKAHDESEHSRVAKSTGGSASTQNQQINANLLNSYTAPVSDSAQLLATWKTKSDKAAKETFSIPLAAHVKPAVSPAFYQPKIAKPGTIRVELVVDEQNTNIGTRNVKTLHAGGKKTVGSGRYCDFLIFLLPVPKNLAEIHYDGESIIIVPKRQEFFQDFSGAKAVALGEKIRIVNSFNRELFISFEQYIPSLDKVNKLLHCIDSPGL